MANADKGVSSAGFTTQVQPAAKADPALRVIIADGKFHYNSIKFTYSMTSYCKPADN